MEYKKRKVGKKNKRNKRGGAETVPTVNIDPLTYKMYAKDYGPGSGHHDPLGNENNTKKLVGKFVIGGAIIAIGIWLLLKFKK